MLKLADNPPIRPPEVESLRALDGSWWVAHTRARQEKALAWELCRGGIGYFLPMIERETFSGGRARRNLYPLFNCYLFFCGDAEARYRVLSTNRVANVIPVHDRAGFVEEVAALEQALDAHEPLQLHPRLVVGTRCRVVRGPMKGTEGTVIEDGNQSRLVLQVSILGQGASLEISADYLEAIE